MRLVLSVATVAVLAARSSPQERKMANRGFEYEEPASKAAPSGARRVEYPTFNSNFDSRPAREQP